MIRHEQRSVRCVMCNCGRGACPELKHPRPPAAPNESLSWRIEIALAGSGRAAAVRVAVDAIHAGWTTHEAVGELLAGRDPTLRTDLELALARRPRPQAR